MINEFMLIHNLVIFDWQTVQAMGYMGKVVHLLEKELASVRRHNKSLKFSCQVNDKYVG